MLPVLADRHSLLVGQCHTEYEHGGKQNKNNYKDSFTNERSGVWCRVF